MEKIKDLLQHEAAAILNIPATDAFYRATDLIYEHVQKRKGKLVCSGMGKAGQIAQNMATTFSSTGTPAVFLHPSDAQHGDLGIIQKNDLLLLISNSGKTREIIELVSLAEKLNGILPLIVISGNPSSELAGKADVMLHTGSPEEICPLKLTPTTSTTTMTVIGDILVVLQMNKIGFTTGDYAKRHHGGYLGHKSRTNINNENNQGSNHGTDH
jgi:arabinose-5-phosphate isomerase